MSHFLLAFLSTLLAGLACAGITLSLGVALWRLLIRRGPSLSEALGPCFLLGLPPLTLLALALLPLGGLVGAAPVATVLAATAAGLVWLWAHGRLGSLLKDLGQAAGAAARRAPLFSAFVGLWVVLLVVVCAAPNTAWDAFTYHYALVEDFRETRSLAPRGFTIYEYWHLNSELLNALWMGVGGERMANVFYLVQVLSLAATAYWGVRRLGGDELFGRVATTLVLGLPVVVHQANGGWADTLLIQALVTAYLGYETGRTEKYAAGWAVLAGLSGGFAWGIKQSALLFLGPLALLILIDLVRSRSRRSYPLLAALSLAALGGPWVLRTWATTGNPFFPAFRMLTRLPTAPNLNLGSQVVPVPLRPFYYLSVHTAWHEILEDSIPLWVPLLGILGAVVALRTGLLSRHRESVDRPYVRLWACSGILLGLHYMVFPIETRYTLPTWVLTLTLGLGALSRAAGYWPRPLTLLCAVSAALLTLGIAGGKAWSRRQVLTGQISERAYLESRYPYLALSAVARARSRPGDALLVFDSLRYRTGLPTLDADPRWPGIRVLNWAYYPAEEVLRNCRELGIRWVLLPYARYSYSLDEWQATEQAAGRASIRATFPEWVHQPIPNVEGFRMRRMRTVARWVEMRRHLQPVAGIPGWYLYELKPEP